MSLSGALSDLEVVDNYLPQYLIFFLLFITPFILFPFNFTLSEASKVIFSEIVIMILVLNQFFTKSKSRNENSDRNQLFLTISIFFLTLYHLIFFSTSTSFFGNQFRLQGIFLLWHLLIFSFLSSKYLIKVKNSLLPFISMAILIFSSLFLGANESGRLVGTLGEPNSLAAVVIFLWPFLFFSSQRKNSRALKILIPLIVIIFIVFTGSRSGLLAIFVQLMFLTMLYILKISLTKATFISVLLVGLTLMFPFMENKGVFENRSEIWQTAWHAGWKAPFLGNGFGNIESTLHQTSKELSNNVQYQFVDSAHNLFLDWWIQGGLVGITFLFTLTGYSFYQFVKKDKRLEVILLLGILTTMLFNPVSVVILLYFWWLIGRGLTKIPYFNTT